MQMPAHESHDSNYVLARKPDFIFYGPIMRYPQPVSLEYATRREYPSDRALRKEPRFAREYALVHIRLADGQYAPVFRRRDYVQSRRDVQ